MEIQSISSKTNCKPDSECLHWYLLRCVSILYGEKPYQQRQIFTWRMRCQGWFNPDVLCVFLIVKMNIGGGMLFESCLDFWILSDCAAALAAAIVQTQGWIPVKKSIQTVDIKERRKSYLTYRQVYYCLFSKSGFTQGCADKGKEIKNTRLIQDKEIIREIG